MAYAHERQVALDAVLKACQLCRTVQAALVNDESMSKRDKSPVTVADFGAQAVVAHELMLAFPNDPMVGEESADELRLAENSELRGKVIDHVRRISPGRSEEQILTAIDHGSHEGGAAGRHWTLDPIDGTKGFLRREQYAVALALIQDGEVVLGVLGCPNLPHDARNEASGHGCIFIAVNGEGAVMRTLDSAVERPIHVSEISDPSQAKFCESVESAHSAQDDSAKVAELLGITQPPYRIDSQCKYAAVARGDASIYLRLPTKKGYEEKIWDHAAGAMVIREAGGRVTDVYGRDLDFSIGRTLRDNTGVVATNGKLHDQVIAAVKEALGL